MHRFIILSYNRTFVLHCSFQTTDKTRMWLILDLFILCNGWGTFHLVKFRWKSFQDTEIQIRQTENISLKPFSFAMLRKTTLFVYFTVVQNGSNKNNEWLIIANTLQYMRKGRQTQREYERYTTFKGVSMFWYYMLFFWAHRLNSN